MTHILDMELLASRAARPLSETPRPFLTWAGSKRLLLAELLSALPLTFGTYFEPFLGAASLYFLLRPKRAYLGDTCRPLIETYQAVAQDPKAVWRHLSPLCPSKELYYRIRENRSVGRFKGAAEFIYLNKTCWNGLYRVNSAGQFNVPFGRPKPGASIAQRDNLLACGTALSSESIRIIYADFERTLAPAGEGDLAYLDPPYVTGHNNNGFIDYNEVLFSWHDQVRLARLASQLLDRGVHVVVSNADHPAIRELYENFRVISFSRKATISGRMTSRGTSSEIIATSN